MPAHTTCSGDDNAELVWDGSSAAGCDGNYGHYMRNNNPHWPSLYLALGLPVIVWKEAVAAACVQDRGVGIAVDDLREIGPAGERIGNEHYCAMAANAVRLGARVWRGDFACEGGRRLAW